MKQKKEDKDSNPINLRYRAHRDFDEIDKLEFKQNSLDIIRKYFKAAIEEMNCIEGFRTRYQDIDNLSFTATVINKGKQNAIAHITVFINRESHGFHDIAFSNSENASTNSSSGGFNLDHDDFDMYLTPNISFLNNYTEKLSAEDAAVMLWTDFIQQAGIINE